MPKGGAPPAWRAWLAATRPRTLWAAAVPVLLGSALAQRDGLFHPLSAAAALVGALLIQVGTNLANDYHDHRRGADANRVGPARASASGWLRPRSVLIAALTCFALAATVGLYLIARAGPPVLVIGLLSLAAGYLYTGGPYPLGYHGWGDLFVLVFFGPVAVGGTYFVQSRAFPPLDVLLGGLAVGAIATAILVVNNLRDRDTDAAVGKRTLAVRIGTKASRVEYSLLVLAPFAIPPLWVTPESPWPLLALGALPIALALVVGFVRTPPGAALNPYLGRTALLLLLYGVLLSIGVVR